MTTRFGAGQFFPERTLCLWRSIVLLCSLVYSGMFAYVVTKEFADRTAAHVAASLPCKIYVLYSAAVLLLLALSFLISGRSQTLLIMRRGSSESSMGLYLIHDICVNAGMIVQHRVRAVLMSYSPSASRMARVRVFLVMVICLSSFTLRSMDVAHLIYHNFNYQERFMRCERLLCYSRWLPEIAPLLVLLVSPLIRRLGGAHPGDSWISCLCWVCVAVYDEAHRGRPGIRADWFLSIYCSSRGEALTKWETWKWSRPQRLWKYRWIPSCVCEC